MVNLKGMIWPGGWSCIRHDEPGGVSEDVVKAPYKSLLDEYDDDGNYIGNNPKYMDKEDSDSEEEYNNNKKFKK